jgi:peptidoglycan hydrolase CwlO-like protein
MLGVDTIDKKVIYGIVIAIAIGISFALFGIYNNRSGTDTSSKQLELIIQQQSELFKRLDRMETGVNDIRQQVGESRRELGESRYELNSIIERIEPTKERLRTDSEIIRDTQSIFEKVRERGQ